MTKTTPPLVLAVASAFLLSAVVPAAVYAAIDFSSLWGRPPADHWELYRTAKIAPAVLVVALGHALLLGLPLALFMRRRRPMTILVCLMCGFLVGAVPILLLGQLSNFMGSASVGGRNLSVNGVPTLYGVWSAARLAAGMGCLGALGGAAFWGTLRVCGIGPLGDFTETSIWMRVIACAMVVFGVAIPVLKLPDYFEIRSCHNLFRYGSTVISPVAIIHVEMLQGDWPRLRAIFAEIAGRYRMSNWDDNSHGTDVLSLSLCNEQGTNIEVNDIHWSDSPEPYRGSYIFLYRMAPDAQFSIIAGDFVSDLAKAWPGKISVQDERGKLVKPQAFLRGQKKPELDFLRGLAG